MCAATNGLGWTRCCDDVLEEIWPTDGWTLEEWVQHQDEDEQFHIVQEIDCCRILTADSYDIVIKCSEKLTKTFEAGRQIPCNFVWGLASRRKQRVQSGWIYPLIRRYWEIEEAVADLLVVVSPDFPDDFHFLSQTC